MSVLDDITAANGVWLYREDVREALLAELDRLRQNDEDGHPATAAYNEALDDVRRWAGGEVHGQ